MKYFYDKVASVVIAVGDDETARILHPLLPPPSTDSVEEVHEVEKPKKTSKVAHKGNENPKKQQILQMLKDGVSVEKIAAKVGLTPAGVKNYRYALNKKKSSAKAKTDDELDSIALKKDENLTGPSNDYGLSFQTIGFIIDARRNSEKSDSEIAADFDLTPVQVKVLWTKYNKDKRFNV